MKMTVKNRARPGTRAAEREYRAWLRRQRERAAEPLRRICFVTGTRAEWGLMRSVVRAIDGRRGLRTQLIVTGMHLDPRHGRSIDQIQREAWLDYREHAIVRWRPVGGEPATVAAATGHAISGIAEAISKLKSEIVLIVGDRVEAFAAAAAGHIAGAVVAHVHGGDRARGQVDDSLRHAITKLSHVHFPATAASAQRIARLGEDHWRIHRVGSPGLDGIVDTAASVDHVGRDFALLVLHPTEAEPKREQARARLVLRAVRRSDVPRTIVIYPNNDPGSAGIIRCWEAEANAERETILRDLPRERFLGLMRDAVALVGNSSSGIIEAASFGTPVIDIGSRQLGRERSENVINLPFDAARIERELKRIWNGGRPVRCSRRNVYGGGGAAKRIADVLARLDLNDERLRRKLIAY
jgi:GDP/UDP-N,N'-diacetylbacillosamine 2-epimerase (hydrolysing)